MTADPIHEASMKAIRAFATGGTKVVLISATGTLGDQARSRQPASGQPHADERSAAANIVNRSADDRANGAGFSPMGWARRPESFAPSRAMPGGCMAW